MAHDVDTGCSKIIRSYDVIRQFLAIVAYAAATVPVLAAAAAAASLVLNR